MKRTWMWFACLVFAQGGVLWGMTAEDVVQKTGIAGGLCSFPRVDQGDEKLALELAKRPAFVVHLLSPNSQAAARIRDAAQDEGVLGRSLYVEKGNAAPLPFADRLADLLIVSDLADADLTPELRKEWLRAVAPRRGAMLVGRAKTAGDGLSLDALTAWTKDLPLAKVFADDSGVWAVLRTDLPAGSDPWTHRLHGPDSTQVSDDATLKPPFLTQWWGLPRQEGFWGTTVVAANGRMFSMRSSRNSSEQVFLTARSLTSGVVLWQQLLRPAPKDKRVPHGGYVPGRSSMVVAGDSLLLIDRDGVLRLNAETGAELGRIAGPKPDGQVKWIACSNGTLAVMSGEADVVLPIAYQTIADNPIGRDVAVYEVESGRQLWRETLPGDVDERLIVVRGDRLYSMVHGTGLTCRELRTGKAVWTNPDPDLQTEFKTPTSKVVSQLLVSQPCLSALEDVILLRAKWAKNTVALSPADGKMLWKKKTIGGSYRALTALPVGGLWVGAGAPMDLKTGEVAAGPKFISSGCGPTTAIPGYLITCFGSVADMKTGAMIRYDDIKSPCDVGSLVAEGMMITVPSECGCNYEVKGYRVLSSAGSLRPHTAPNWKERLTVLDPAEPKPLDLSDADWPTYRRDPQRSAGSAATVGAEPKILWQWKPAGAAPYCATFTPGSAPRTAADFMATAPVAAAGYVWFGSHDGVVRCVKAADGKEVWNFPTGAMLFAPPTIWNGRALVGGGDGRIYCLDAATGRCLWQLMAAPMDRRVFWFGHLISTWPVVPGVAVQDGVAYAVAGFQKENGIHAYAFDPASGKVLWEKDDAGTGGAVGPNSAYSNSGQIALGGGKLWLCSASTPPGAFDLQSGDWKPSGAGQFGSEIGVLGGKWVIQGGRRLSETQDTLSRPLSNSGFAACAIEKLSQRVSLNDAGTALPAWDAELAVVPPKDAWGALTAVPTERLLDRMSGKDDPATAPKPAAGAPQSGVPAAPEFRAERLLSAARPAGQDALALADGPRKAKTAPRPQVRRPLIAAKKQGLDWSDLKSWATEDMLLVAFALAKDQIVVAYEGRTGNHHKLSGFLRADGSKAWTVELPEQAVMNRLAVDREGRVIVALCDGSILCVGK